MLNKTARLVLLNWSACNSTRCCQAAPRPRKGIDLCNEQSGFASTLCVLFTGNAKRQHSSGRSCAPLAVAVPRPGNTQSSSRIRNSSTAGTDVPYCRKMKLQLKEKLLFALGIKDEERKKKIRSSQAVR